MPAMPPNIWVHARHILWVRDLVKESMQSSILKVFPFQFSRSSISLCTHTFVMQIAPWEPMKTMLWMHVHMSPEKSCRACKFILKSFSLHGVFSERLKQINRDSDGCSDGWKVPEIWLFPQSIQPTSLRNHTWLPAPAIIPSGQDGRKRVMK